MSCGKPPLFSYLIHLGIDSEGWALIGKPRRVCEGFMLEWILSRRLLPDLSVFVIILGFAHLGRILTLYGLKGPFRALLPTCNFFLVYG